MWLEILQGEGIRNLAPFNIESKKGVNLVLSNNGACKTTFLEAVCFLTHGGTFRGKKYGQMLNTNVSDRKRGFTFLGPDRSDLQIWHKSHTKLVLEEKRLTFFLLHWMILRLSAIRCFTWNKVVSVVLMASFDFVHNHKKYSMFGSDCCVFSVIMFN
ncbi:AAA family ATPase [Thiorhodovibrio winogradskyi]|uniref:AAA family ATPase n=1 Tax=Thiorhodovibrio winogradskyi TaxID=77007 RepID=UPI0038B475BD